MKRASGYDEKRDNLVRTAGFGCDAHAVLCDRGNVEWQRQEDIVFRGITGVGKAECVVCLILAS